MVIHVVHGLHCFDTGGMEKGITTLVRNASDGFEHTVLCFSHSGPTARLLPPGTRVVEMHKQPGNSPRFLWKLSRTLKSLAPDVVHTRNWGGIDGIVGARLAGLKGVVHGEHGWDMVDPEGKSPKRRRARRFLSRWVREYTCVSRAIAHWLKEEVGVRRAVTPIINGVDTEQLRPGREGASVRQELGIHGGAFVVGIVSRLDPIKDHPTLFRAFERVRAKLPDARLLVVGDGPEETKLRALASDGIELIGRREDVDRILRVLDVFVLCSLNEGISNTILEAMATGLPCVVTRVGGNPELVEDGVCGRLVRPGDDAGLAEALLAYGRDADLRVRHGEAARATAQERFSVQRMVAAYEQVWNRVAGGTG